MNVRELVNTLSALVQDGDIDHETELVDMKANDLINIIRSEDDKFEGLNRLYLEFE